MDTEIGGIASLIETAADEETPFQKKELPKHHEIPFDSDRKRRTVLRLTPDERLRAFTNGAPDGLLPYGTHIDTCAVSFLSETEAIGRAETLANLRVTATVVGTLLLQMGLLSGVAATRFFETSPMPWSVTLTLALLLILEAVKARRRVTQRGFSSRRSAAARTDRALPNIGEPQISAVVMLNLD